MGKVSAATEEVAPELTDKVYLVGDPGGSPLSRNAEVGNILLAGQDAPGESSPAGSTQVWAIHGGALKLVNIEDINGLVSITYTHPTRCTLSLAQDGTTAWPAPQPLDTAGGKITGWVLPDGSDISTINFSCPVPDSLAASPNARVQFTLLTLAAVGGSNNARLTVKSSGKGDGEVLDAAYQVETEQTVAVPTTTETIITYTQALTTAPAAEDTLIGQLERDPSDALDTFAGNLLLHSAVLLIDRTIP